MKKLRPGGILGLFLLLSAGMAGYGQPYQSSVPGDNFSLEGALELFKQSSSPEDFERLLNAPESRVNNLDLNGDGEIDYIKVIDRSEGNIHAFILQDVVTDSEYQDVAVIELEKLGNGKATLQITGDEDIYGIETIIEPTEEVRVNAGTMTARAPVNVWVWPSVQYVYSPYYTVWISPWSWYRRPIWWHTWHPIAYYDYAYTWRPYHAHYSACYTHRISYAHNLYRPYRSTSVVVYNRHHQEVAAYRRSHHDHDNNEGNHYQSGHHGNRPAYQNNASDNHHNTRGNQWSAQDRDSRNTRSESHLYQRHTASTEQRHSRESRSPANQGPAFQPARTPQATYQQSGTALKSHIPAKRDNSHFTVPNVRSSTLPHPNRGAMQHSP